VFERKIDDIKLEMFWHRIRLEHNVKHDKLKSINEDRKNLRNKSMSKLYFY
jgi:hypothetical protein